MLKKILIPIIRFLSLLDFIFRKIVGWLLGPFYRYERVGSCRQCGQCCKNIVIYMEPKFLKRRPLRNFAIWWNSYFNNLYHIGSFLDDGYMVFSCHYLQADGKCGNYNILRPLFCHEYPRRFKYFEVPPTLPGCGYKFVVKKDKS